MTIRPALKCTSEEWHALVVSVDRARGEGQIRVSKIALDHLLQDHATLLRLHGADVEGFK